MQSFTHTTRSHRKGMTLIVCLFVALVTSVLCLGILETAMSQMGALRHAADYERALYLAGAGAHEGIATLEGDNSFRGTIGPVTFPTSGQTYTVTIADVGSDVVITSAGTSNSVTRSLEVTLSVD